MTRPLPGASSKRCTGREGGWADTAMHRAGGGADAAGPREHRELRTGGRRVTLETRHSWFTGGDNAIQAAGPESAASHLLDPFLRLLPDLLRGVAAVISEPSRHCTVELQALPSRIGQVRRIISAQLRYWHLDPL